MLSTNPLLQNSRYRLDHLISAGPTAQLYKAFDNLVKQPIVILRSEIDDLSSMVHVIDGRSLVHLHHDGLVRITDHFQEAGCSYTATEPLAANEILNERSAKTFQSLGIILHAMSTLRSEFPSISGMEIAPQTFLKTADNKLKFLSIYPAEIVTQPNPMSSPYLPLERIWDELDHINQKAIYKTYDDSALAVLESPADERSDLYSLGAVFYKFLTGVEPLSAFERSIDMLDTRVDPLTAPLKLNPEISVENSAFLMRLLEIRRERRFASTEGAIASLPPAPKTNSQLSENPDVDDMDLLEIPDLNQIPAAVSAAQRVPRVAAPVALKNLSVEKSPVETPQEIKPPIAEMIAEPLLKITVEPQKVMTPQIASSSPDIFSAEAFIEKDGVPGVPQKKPLKVAAMFAVAVALLAVGGWGILTFSTSSKSAVNPSAAVVVEPSSTADIQPKVNAGSSPQPITVSDNQPLPADEPAAKTVLAETSSSESKPRPQIAETRPAKPREKKPNDEKPKKKLTVDDLINNN